MCAHPVRPEATLPIRILEGRRGGEEIVRDVLLAQGIVSPFFESRRPQLEKETRSHRSHTRTSRVPAAIWSGESNMYWMP